MVLELFETSFDTYHISSERAVAVELKELRFRWKLGQGVSRKSFGLVLPFFDHSFER